MKSLQDRHMEEALLLGIPAVSSKPEYGSNMSMFDLPRLSGILRDTLYLDCTPVLFLIYDPKWTEYPLFSVVYFRYGPGTGLSLNPHTLLDWTALDESSGLAGRLCGGENAVWSSMSYDLREIVDRAVLACSSCTPEYASYKFDGDGKCRLCGEDVKARYTKVGAYRDEICLSCLAKIMPDGAFLSPQYIYEDRYTVVDGFEITGVMDEPDDLWSITSDVFGWVEEQAQMCEVYDYDEYNDDEDEDEDWLFLEEEEYQ